MRLNKNSPIPLYLQLARIIEDRIVYGELKAGDRLTSENKLAEEFGIGRPTVRHALDHLREKGYITRRKGSGNFVAEHKEKKEVSIFGAAGITEAFKKENIKIRKKLIENIYLKEPDEKRNPFSGRLTYYFSRLDISEEKSVIFEKFYIDKEMFWGLEKYNLEKVQLSELAEVEYFLKVSRIKQNFKAIISDAYIGNLFGFKKNQPLLYIEREIYFELEKTGKVDNFGDKAEKMGIYSEIYVNTEGFDFYQEIGR
ncbi:MAG: GntR family transcriptional regulator [Brevinematia bacterium]